MNAQKHDYLISIKEFGALKQTNLFKSLRQPQFTGKITLTGPQGKPWFFYLYLGRLLYATGGIHSVRRWKRNLTIHLPMIVKRHDLLDKYFKKINEFDVCWEYEFLSMLIKDEKISRKKINELLETIIEEVFFDLTQEAQVDFILNNKEYLSKQLVLMDTDKIITKASEAWKAWRNAKLADRSPNMAPVIRQPEELRKRTTIQSYENITKILDGKHSLRDLAVKIKKDILQITRLLIPYIELGIIELVKIPDLPNPIPQTPKKEGINKAEDKKLLIACIDDSPLICQRMEEIITKGGYDFIGIKDPIKAIAVILAHKPDLIFLDLLMPNTNGYEICSQLRKLSLFRNTPIIILTGQDGMIERVRTKIVGSNDFLSKPIEANLVLETISKYLLNNSNEQIE